MSNTTEPNDHTDVRSRTPSSARQKRRWTRTHVIWFLIGLSLTPALFISQFREFWAEEVPGAARIVTYVVSGLLIVAACVLIVKAPDGASSPEEPGPSGRT